MTVTIIELLDDYTTYYYYIMIGLEFVTVVYGSVRKALTVAYYCLIVQVYTIDESSINQGQRFSPLLFSVHNT